MSKPFTFELITPDGLTFESQVYQVLLPTTTGTIGILAGHEHVMAIVQPGVVTVFVHDNFSEDKAEYLAVAGGFAEITGKTVKVLADSAERADEIDEMKAMQALEKAKQLRSEAKDQVALGEALSILEREAVRLKVAGLRRRAR